jgi:hypothetical protein
MRPARNTYQKGAQELVVSGEKENGSYKSSTKPQPVIWTFAVMELGLVVFWLNPINQTLFRERGYQPFSRAKSGRPAQPVTYKM